MRELVRPCWKEIVYAHRLVHIDNLPHIVTNGIVHQDSEAADPDYIPIGDQSVISVREQLHQGYRLSDYIPFYFGPRGPMLYVIQSGFNGVTAVPPEDLVYVVVKIDTVVEQGWDCIFTDGHAVTEITSFYAKEDLPRLSELVKVEDVYARFWKDDNDLDLGRRKQAELLIKDEIPFSAISGFFVYNELAENKLVRMGIDSRCIRVEPNYYF